MPKLVAYCGIDCAKCPAYRFPRLGEKLRMRRLFQSLLRRGMKSKGLEQPPGDIVCDGCTTIDARCLKPCLSCAVRCCAMETGVENCAACAKFPCAPLEQVWKVTIFRDAEGRIRRQRERYEAGQRPG